MKIIYLTQEQADKVRGRHGKYSALDPIMADNGMFILPVEVLNDPEHKEVLSQLGECKFAEIDVTEVVNVKLPVDDINRTNQVLSVKEVSSVSITAEKEMTVKPVYEKVLISEPIIKK